jgi:exosortase/archaeosortase family protein
MRRFFKSRALSIFKKSAYVLFLPAVELISLRLYLHHVLRLKIGFPGTTDFDYIIPVPVAVFVLLYALDRAEPLFLKLQKKVLGLNILFFALFTLLNHSLIGSTGPFPSIFWGGLLFFLTGSALLVLMDPFYLLRNKNKLVLFPSLLIAFLIPLYMKVLEGRGDIYKIGTYRVLKKIFGIFFHSFATVKWSEGAYPQILNPILILTIGRGCIGTESALLFTLLFAIFFGFNPHLFSKRKMFCFYLGGLVLMFFVNQLRIVTLFWTGVALRSYLDFKTATAIFKLIAHTHVGWVFYLTATLAYFLLLFVYALWSENIKGSKSRMNFPPGMQPT